MSHPERPTVRELPPSRVLLVDDEDALRRLFARLLRSWGYEVTEAANGTQGLAALEASTFDAICSDISMPDLDGIELLRAVRKRDLDVPVVLLTGAPSIESAGEAIRLGALDYLVKPVDNERLKQSMARAVRLGRLGRAKRAAISESPPAGHGAGDRAGLEVTFEATMRSLWMAYQPILTRDGALFGYEALMRSREPALPHPGAVLDAAEKLDRLEALGRRIRALSAMQVAGRVEVRTLFVNLHPRDLRDDELLSDDSPLRAIADRVVLEITERATIDKMESLAPRIAELRSAGYRIAIDDLGAGYAGLTAFAVLEPDIVKLDMTLIRGLDGSRTKQRIVGSITDACRDLGTLVVAEGVETRGEWTAVLDAGCDLVQGYLFAKPAEPFPAFSWPAPT